MTTDNDTSYGQDQDREPPQTARPTSMSDEWQKAADLNPDDFPDGDADDGAGTGSGRS